MNYAYEYMADYSLLEIEDVLSYQIPGLAFVYFTLSRPL